MSIVDATAHRAEPAATSCTRRRESDLTLIKQVRQGDVKAYARLYERHVAAAGNLARQLTRSPAEADDLVSEAFAKVLDMLRAGRRPVQAFRAYLLTALRHTAYDKTRANRKIQLADDISTVTGIRAESVSTAFTDTAVAALEHSLAAQAFTQLPDRWQEVLWHTEVEGRAPSDVAAIIGLRPNGVSALAYRARKGLCAAYLQAQLRESDVDRPCQPTFALLGAWACDSPFSTRKKTQIAEHVADCDSCRDRVRELADTNPTLVRRCASERVRPGRNEAA